MGLRIGTVRWVVWLALAAPVVAQPFAMRYRGNVGDFEGRRSMDVGVGTAHEIGERAVEFRGRDLGGKPWSVAMEVIGGVGWTEVFAADFDANGREDLLVAAHFPGCGYCVASVTLTLLLFDGEGRPVSYSMETQVPKSEIRFPFVPVLVFDKNRNGRAEFVLTECERFEDLERIASVLEAHEARLVPVPSAEAGAYQDVAGPMKSTSWSAPPVPYGSVTEKLDEIFGGEFGCDAFQAPSQAPEPPTLLGYFPVAVREFTASPCNGETEGMSISAKTVLGWPSVVVIDEPSGRSIHATRAISAMERVLRMGFKVRWTPESTVLWADGSSENPSRVTVSMDVAASRRKASHPVENGDGCYDVHYAGRRHMDATIFRRCAGRDGWSWLRGSRRVELPAGGRCVRSGYTAMGHTSTGETCFEPIPGGGSLMGVADVDFRLTEWRQGTRRRFALHDDDGRLVSAEVEAPVDGDLLFAEDAVVYSVPRGGRPTALVELRGRLRWRRR